MLKWPDILTYANEGNPSPDRRVEKTEAEWKEILTPEQFQITRLKGTERPYTGAYCTAYEPGQYSCVGCDTLLFDAQEQFNSKSGWPSFTQPAKVNVIKYENDYAHGMHRIEVLCNTCDAHLGHIFPDGPAPSRLRYCINSVSIKKSENAS